MSGSPPAGVSKQLISPNKIVPLTAAVTWPRWQLAVPCFPIMSPAALEFNPVRSIIILVCIISPNLITSDLYTVPEPPVIPAPAVIVVAAFDDIIDDVILLVAGTLVCNALPK